MVNHKAIRHILIILAAIAAVNTILIAFMLPLTKEIAIAAIVVQVVVVIYLVVIAWKLLKLTKNEE